MNDRARVVAGVLLVASLLAAGGAGGVVACQSAVSLDVTYTDAGAPDAKADGPPMDGMVETPPSSEKGTELEGCPCDETQGLACCVSKVGPPFCTTDLDRCNAEKGAFYRCFGPDRNTESVCCWHGSGEGALTALAAVCSGGPEACLTNTDCTGGKACKTRDCPQNVKIGACGEDPPACPF